MKVSELFALPLRVVPHNSDPNWGAGIAEADDHVWVISVNPRTTGGFSPKLLVSAQERAEAIVAAVNERDEMAAIIAELLRQLWGMADSEYSMAEFRNDEIVAAAEKYAPDWAEGETK